jgi:uncharacterized RDD family membrane protein YckC
MNRLPAAGFARRIAAALYDALLLAALMMLVTLVLVAVQGQALLPGNLVHRLTLLGTAAVFFGAFWKHGGQTLGMRTWRLRVELLSGADLDWPVALLRFAAALVSLATVGLGFLWILVDPEKLAWHDRIAGTRVVVLPKEQADG